MTFTNLCAPFLARRAFVGRYLHPGNCLAVLYDLGSESGFPLVPDAHAAQFLDLDPRSAGRLGAAVNKYVDGVGALLEGFLE